MLRNILLAGGIVLLFSLFVFAEESITITTYYPSPYGSYKALSAWKMGVGTNYSNSTNMGTLSDSNLIVEGSVGIGTTSPTQKLDVSGTVNATAYNAAGTPGMDGPTSGGIIITVSSVNHISPNKMCFKKGLLTAYVAAGDACP
jgi:hypothetical protein